jgi:hypothetical protein
MSNTNPPLLPAKSTVPTEVQIVSLIGWHNLVDAVCNAAARLGPGEANIWQAKRLEWVIEQIHQSSHPTTIDPKFEVHKFKPIVGCAPFTDYIVIRDGIGFVGRKDGSEHRVDAIDLDYCRQMVKLGKWGELLKSS